MSDTDVLRLLAVADQLAQPHAPDKVRLLINEIAAAIGADQWVFVSVTAEPESFDDHRFIAGCDQLFCLKYLQHHWYLTDPLIAYARTNAAPCLVSQLPIRTPGQRLLLDTAREAGFADGFVVPAHLARRRVGALYLAFRTVEAEHGQLLDGSRAALRSIAASLLDWELDHAARQLIEVTRLTKREIELLRYELEGFTAKEIATLTALPVNTIHRGFGSAISKLGVANKREAARYAQATGLAIDRISP